MKNTKKLEKIIRKNNRQKLKELNAAIDLGSLTYIEALESRTKWRALRNIGIFVFIGNFAIAIYHNSVILFAISLPVIAMAVISAFRIDKLNTRIRITDDKWDEAEANASKVYPRERAMKILIDTLKKPFNIFKK